MLVLKNGDRITDDIKRIWDSEITIEPEYSDEFNVDVPTVDYNAVSVSQRRLLD